MHSVQLWELACLRRRPASRPISFGCTQSNCGSELAREGGLPANPYLSDALGPICGAWLACEGGLPADPYLSDALSPIVGASLLAKAACQPTHIFRMHSVQFVGPGLPAKAACQPTHIFRMHSVQLWERACSRRRPASRPISFGCTQSNCGSWLACEGGQPADLSL